MGLIKNYTYPQLKGRCHKCVFAANVSVYMRQSPVCLYEYEGQVYNIAENVERFTCFNDDPRLYEDIECKTPTANDTFDCFSGCQGTPELVEGMTYSLEADRRCVYKVNFWNKTTTSQKLLFSRQGQEMPVLNETAGVLN